MKNIEETFAVKFGTDNRLSITARSFNQHIIGLHGNSINTKGMITIAEFLIETAKRIDADKDFNEELK